LNDINSRIINSQEERKDFSAQQQCHNVEDFVVDVEEVIAEASEEAGAVAVEIVEAGAVVVEIAAAFVVDEEAEGVVEVAVEPVQKFESSGMVSACDIASFC
jgi:hypothetical protein